MPEENKKLEVIICTEEGSLEGMSKLLVYSLRNFGGKFKNVPVYSYQPRPDFPVSNSTLHFFKENNVEHITLSLNTKYPDYPLANKPYVSAHREKHSSADILVFLDSDTLFLDQPDIFDDLGEYDVGLKPVDYNNIGTDQSFSGKEGEYWSLLYQCLGIQPRTTVQTSVDKQKILEYYNSGFIITKRENELFGQWRDNFERVMEKGLMPQRGLFFVEQSTFSATVTQLGLRLKYLGDKYNYPLKTYAYKWRGWYPYNLKNVKHVHYHKLFKKNKGVARFKRKLAKLKGGKKLNDAINKFILKGE